MKTSDRKAGEFIKNNSDQLAKEILITHSENKKKYKINMGDDNPGIYLNEVKFQLAYLSESLLYSAPELFFNALSWGKIFLPSVNVPSEGIEFMLRAMKETLKVKLPEEIKSSAVDFIEDAIKIVNDLPSQIPSFLNSKRKLYSESKKYLELLLVNNKSEANKLILHLVTKGTEIKDIYLEIFQPTQYELGRMWQMGMINVSQEHYCTAATQLIMAQLYPYIFKTKKTENVFVGTCVSGELHEIGIRMLSDFLELKGWNTFYLGANMPNDSIIQTIIDRKPDVIGISATMTFHVEKAERLIKAIRDTSECSNSKIIVGGYVFKLNDMLWSKIGADMYGEDLENAFKKVSDSVLTA